jgi:hypothetical protein
MPGLCRTSSIIVVAPILILDRSSSKILFSVIQTCKIDCVELSTKVLQPTSGERPDAALLAKEVVKYGRGLYW